VRNPINQAYQVIECFSLATYGKKDKVPHEVWQLGEALILEEVLELSEALHPVSGEPDLVATADALADILVVTMQMMIRCGIPVSDILDAVHESNMSKLGPDGQPIFRSDGKFLKGPNYVPPTAAIAARLASHPGLEPSK
jgi:predicted HAD superfamily Cof-like phosphohydrolase